MTEKFIEHFAELIMDAEQAILAEAARKRLWEPSYEPAPDTIRKQMTGHVWTLCINRFGSRKRTYTPLLAESVILSLQHGGIARDHIKFRKNCFRIILPNHEYRIYKRDHGFAACPWTGERGPSEVMNIPPEVFAEFIFRFDERIPDILHEADRICGTIREQVLEDRRKRMADEILERTVRSLTDRYLKPLGVSVRHHFNEDGTAVSLELTRVMSGNLVIPLEQLAETLRDSRAIIDSLKPVPVSHSEPIVNPSALFTGKKTMPVR